MAQMRQKLVSLTARHFAFIRTIADTTPLSQAEVIRIALDEYIDREEFLNPNPKE